MDSNLQSLFETLDEDLAYAMYFIRLKLQGSKKMVTFDKSIINKELHSTFTRIKQHIDELATTRET
jgi:hypothetical protein